MGRAGAVHRWRRRSAAVIVQALVGVLLVSPEATGLSGSVSVDGGASVGVLSSLVAREYSAFEPDVRVSVGISDERDAFAKFCRNQIDAVGAARPIKAAEAQTCADEGVETVELMIARDAIAVVVHPTNSFATCLTVAELNSIWKSGSSVTNWNQVRTGFPSQTISLFGPGSGTGTFDYFTEKINGQAGTMRTDYSASADPGITVQGVGGSTSGLAIADLAYTFPPTGQPPKVKTVGVGAGCVEPTRETIQDGTYTPLSRPLFAYTSVRALESAAVVSFMRFYLDSVSNIALNTDGYVELTEAEIQASKDTLEAAIPNQCVEPAGEFAAADVCEVLAGTITDGHGGAMIGLPVDLYDESNSLIATTTTDASGGYSCESAACIQPDSFTLRVTLSQAEAPLFKTHYKQGAEPVRVERQITPADFGNPVDIDLTDGPTLVSNLPSDAKTYLDDVAVIHRRSKQYVDFLISTFALPPQDWGEPTVRTHALESMFPRNKKCETSCYDPLIGTLYINFSQSFFGARDAPNDDGPENVEWHELTHHFMEIENIANKSDCYQVGDTNHGGWDNHSTCDSLAEGFPVFLPAYASRVIDGATDDTYATFGSLEWNSRKAWSNDGTIEREDFAVAATLWDLADTDPTGPVFDSDATSVLPSGSGIVPIPVTYRDEVAIGFETVSLLVRQSKPQTVKELYDAFQASASVPAAVKNDTVDLDQDTFGDVSPLDVVFLLHGFYIPEGPDDLYRLDTPIARTDHEPSGVPRVLLERHGAPHAPGSEVLIRNDGAFSRIVTVTVSDGVSDAVYTAFVPPGQEIVQLLDLPPFVTPRIEPGDPLPPCGPDNYALLSITIEAPGIPPLETDSCQFAHAIEDSNGEPALTYAITPPDGTIQGRKNAAALGDGIYNTNGSGQTSLTKVKRGKTAIYQITAQNDGIAPDTLTVTGCRSSRGFKVSYFDEATNVTSQVTGSGLSTGALAPGEFEALTLKIKVGKAGPKNKSCLVTATSQNSPSLQDVVVGKVKVKG